MRLATRIQAFEWLLVALLVGVSALGIELVRSSSLRSAEIIRNDFRSLRTAERLRESLWRFEVARSRTRLGEGRPQEVLEARESFDLALLTAKAERTSSADVEAVVAIERASNRYFAEEVTIETVLQTTSKLIELDEAEMERSAASAVARGRTAMNLIGGAGSLALALAMILAWRTSRRVTAPLEALRGALVGLASGRSDRRVPMMTTEETLAEMSRAVNLLADRVELAEKRPFLEHERALAALDELLRAQPRPMMVLDLTRAPVLSNEAARARLEGAEGSLDANGPCAKRLRSARGTPIGWIVALPPSPSTGEGSERSG
ncbi:hypothetical protein L6R52_06075 [Myxococcota bacterium]|nr:hypothetical protein [Myxococcota bacterium]